MAGLKTYRAKRKFGVTTEPKGRLTRKRGHAFVIQKHAARRLHYDLRLELNGVMKSWAVTRGPSLVPGEKRLAVEVEDHPVEYNKFEGTIPAGEYGGGTVMIWDRGTWAPQDDPHQGLHKGHLAFTLDGEKLHGAWHLVRMRPRPGEKRNNWLLIKQHDQYERTARDKDILEQMPHSVASGRTIEEIAKGTPKTPGKTAKPTTVNSRREKSAMAAILKRTAKTMSASRSSPHRRTRSTLPPFVVPELATLADKAPDSGNWICEIKFDGYRIQARLDDGRAKLLTRKGLDWTDKFPTIAAAVTKLPAQTALIDGDLVAEADNGVSNFSLLQEDLKRKHYGRMVLYVFDLMHLDGEDLRALPLTERKRRLGLLVARQPKNSPLRFSESFSEKGSVLLKSACKLGLEGIMSKRADAPYRSGRGHDWIKAKCSDRQELVIAGFVPSTADAHAVGALVLGYYRHGQLEYAGRTGTGFTRETARDLYRKLMALRVASSPFAPIPHEERGVRAPVWVAPKLVAEVDFHGWTHGDRVRQSSFQGLRHDKSAREVVREVKSRAARTKPTALKRSAPKKNNPVSIAGIALSHPDRVYWPDAGVTKRDLAEFYKSIWKWMAPHLVGRPIALVRCPDGIAGQCFFQKHVSAGVSAEHIHQVAEKGGKIIAIDGLDGLIALVQAGVLEVHTRGSTIAHLDKADRLVFDLDPGPGAGWKDVVVAARDIGERLQSIGLKTFVKTTGGKGLHIVVPIRPVPWDEAKDFCQAVATTLAADTPDRYVATATKAKRSNRIFIDYLRNSREATAIAPYSTRARAGAPVAAPVDWAELATLKSANQYTVRNLPARLARLRKDPWAGIGKVRQALPKFR
jgi:bifunctional non-homologous end joining protein LigD